MVVAITQTQASILTQAKDRCYPGVIDSEGGYWIDTLTRMGFIPRDGLFDLPKLRADIQASLDSLDA